MELQRLTEELLLTVTSLNRSCIPQSVQEHLKGENFLLSYLDEHGGCSTPGVLREVLGVSAPRTAADAGCMCCSSAHRLGSPECGRRCQGGSTTCRSCAAYRLRR